MPGKRISGHAIKNAEKLLKYYEEMGYQNICISSAELGAGISFLKKHDYSGSLFLSANVLKEGKLVFEPGRGYNIKGKKVWVIALTDLFSSSSLAKEGIKIDDPISAIKKLWGSIPKQTDIVILLTSLNQLETRKILKTFPEIDLVISSGIGMPTYVPLKEGKSLIVSTHPKGKSIGIIAIDVANGKIVTYDNKLIMLKDSMLENNF